jgi:hypothetical protein
MLALTLLTASGEDKPVPDAARQYKELAPAVRAVALRLEILDPKEKNYLLAHAQDFEADLRVLRGRYRELSTAPALAEALRFPRRDLVNEMLSFNRALRQDLESRLEVDAVHSEELRAVLMETDQLYRIWDAVRDARCEYHYVDVRRRALQDLRQLVGDRAFYSAQLPPHVPIWRFPSGD